MDKIKVLNSSLVYLIMPVIMNLIVFTNKEIENQTDISRNTIARILNKLVELEIIEKDNTYAKKAYKYTKIYNVFIN